MPEQSDKQLLAHLNSPSHVYQIHAQRELLRRGPTEGGSALANQAADSKLPLHGRVATIYTLSQIAELR